MSIALTGTSSSGKTTLAQAFAYKHSFLHLPSPALEAFQELGLPFENLNFSDRSHVQWLILEKLERQYHDNRRHLWIADRSPICALVNFLSASAEHTTKDQEREIERYAAKCIKLMNRHVSMAVYLPPCLPYAESNARPLQDSQVIASQHIIYMTLLQSKQVMCYKTAVSEGVTDLQTRIGVVESFWRTWECVVEKMMEGRMVH